MAGKRGSYTDESKQDAVRLVDEEGLGYTQVGITCSVTLPAALGVRPSTRSSVPRPHCPSLLLTIVCYCALDGADVPTPGVLERQPNIRERLPGGHAEFLLPGVGNMAGQVARRTDPTESRGEFGPPQRRGRIWNDERPRRPERVSPGHGARRLRRGPRGPRGRGRQACGWDTVPLGGARCAVGAGGRTPYSLTLGGRVGPRHVEAEVLGPSSPGVRTLVRDVLAAWDPIGVADERPDEYDGYIRPICELLRAKSDVEEVAAYLRWMETERMGLPPTSRGRLDAIATRLSSISPPSTDKSETGVR